MVWAPDYVTVAELKSFVNLNDSLDDATMAFAVSAASRAIDDHTNRQFGVVAAPEVRTYEAEPDYENGYWVVDVDDFQTVTGLVVTVDAATVTTFVKEPKNALQKGRPWTSIRFTADSQALPSTHPHDVSVTALWGWTAVPVAVKEATLIQANRLHTRRNAPFGVIGSADMGTELRLLAKVDPDVAVSLHGYVRPRTCG